MRLLLQSVIVALLFIVTPGHAQNFYYAPEGKTFLALSKNKIVLKFAKGISFEQQRNLLAKESLLSPISPEQVLPAPSLTLVDLQVPQDEKALTDLLQRLQRQSEILFAHPFLEHEDGTLHGITDQLIVRLTDQKDILPMQFLLERYGAKVIKSNEFDPLQFHIQVASSNQRNALAIANDLFETGLFAFSEPDFLRLMKRMNTSDAFVNQQWALKNDGVNTDQYGGVVDADMKVFDAWGSTSGSSGIKIAILDEGVDLGHPDLQANLLGGYDATGQGSAGAPSGDDAHGTACAGIAAGVGNNGIGISGVAYGCKIIPVRIAYSSGSNWVTSNSWIGNAINWAWQTGNADVLSNSWGGGSSSSTINNAITNAVNDGRGGLGSPVLFAAGNDNGANSYPATFEPTISVIAMSMCNERKSPTSCDGENWWGSNYGTGADVAAPGVKIYATDISGAAGYNSGDYLSNFNGTSSACPNAAGVMALILSANSNLTEAQARATLEGSCDKVGGYTYIENVIGQSAGSWSQELGYGRVNAARAIAALGCSECLLCTDGVQNGQETGVDCGGPLCPTCPTCDDGVQNGNETGVDCGGTDCEPCACFSSPLKLTLNFDHYPEETSWNIRTQGGVTVASGGTYESQPDLSTLVEDINIGDGEYIFTLSDAYGDGICCNYGQGSFSLEDANGTLILAGSQFQASISESFCASVPTPSCDDGIQNGDETGVDCGGACEPCITCDDGIQNGDETGIDCGGACEPCVTCDDGIQNGDETGVDCGGACEPCVTCDDGIQNGDETGVDCGGACEPCVTCDDGIQNGDETGVDCGGACEPCVTCDDGIQNGDETGIDCGGACEPCATCDDGIQNGDETGVDCGGACEPCVTCDDGIQNGDETGIDCGGACEPCITCDDGIQNGDETGIDCGGACEPCITCDDGIQNGDETGVDCGGACEPCVTCDDGIQNGDETGVDCGGACEPCVTCDDGIQNGDETGIDCGGACQPCVSCDDGIQNGDETGVDCGGACEPCITCDDGIQNGDETGIDCGGACQPCEPEECSTQIIDVNDFEAGWGIWIDGGSDARRSRGDRNYASSGLYCIRLRDNSNSSVITTEVLDLENYEDVSIDFAFIARSMDNRWEDFWLQVSYDGGDTYSTIQTWARRTDFQNNTHYTESVYIEGPFSASTTFRFRCDASSNSDWIYLDDIIISGCATSRSATNPNTISQNNLSITSPISSPLSTDTYLSNFHLFPNPASAEINLHFDAKESGNIAIQLTDMSGKIIQQQRQNITEGKVRQILNVSGLASGMYFVRLVSEKTFLSKKVIIIP